MTRSTPEDEWFKQSIDRVFSEIPLEPGVASVEQQIVRDLLYGSDGITLTPPERPIQDFCISVGGEIRPYAPVSSTIFGNLCIDTRDVNPDGDPEFTLIVGTMFMMPDLDAKVSDDEEQEYKMKISLEDIVRHRSLALEGILSPKAPFIVVKGYVGTGGLLLSIPTLSLVEIAHLRSNGEELSPDDFQKINIQFGSRHIERFMPTVAQVEEDTVEEVSARFMDGTWKRASRESSAIS